MAAVRITQHTHAWRTVMFGHQAACAGDMGDAEGVVLGQPRGQIPIGLQTRRTPQTQPPPRSKSV